MSINKDFTYGNTRQSKGVSIPKNERSKTYPNIEAVIYGKCAGCSYKNGIANKLGTHCGYEGLIKIHDNKCAVRE